MLGNSPSKTLIPLKRRLRSGRLHGNETQIQMLDGEELKPITTVRGLYDAYLTFPKLAGLHILNVLFLLLDDRHNFGGPAFLVVGIGFGV